MHHYILYVREMQEKNINIYFLFCIKKAGGEQTGKELKKNGVYKSEKRLQILLIFIFTAFAVPGVQRMRSADDRSLQTAAKVKI